MCRRVQCSKCDKPTWAGTRDAIDASTRARARDDDDAARDECSTERLTADAIRSGCGMHIESALAGVAVEDRCACERGSVFGSLFGSLFGGKQTSNKEGK